MPIVMIYQSPRSAELRAAAIESVTNALVGSYGLRPEQVQVYFHEVADGHWGRGGALASASADEGG